MNEEMIDIERELKQGLIFAPKAGIFESSGKDLDMIPFLSLGLTTSLKVERRAKNDAEKAIKNLDGDFAQAVYEVELRNRLIYWAVVYGLSVDDKPAIEYVGDGFAMTLDHMENYIEYRLGAFKEAYENLGLEILCVSGLDYLLPVDDEPQEDEETTLAI